MTSREYELQQLKQRVEGSLQPGQTVAYSMGNIADGWHCYSAHVDYRCVAHSNNFRLTTEDVHCDVQPYTKPDTNAGQALLTSVAGR